MGEEVIEGGAEKFCLVGVVTEPLAKYPAAAPLSPSPTTTPNEPSSSARGVSTPADEYRSEDCSGSTCASETCSDPAEPGWLMVDVEGQW